MKEVVMSDNSAQFSPNLTPAEERLESICRVSFLPFRQMTRGYADAMAKLAPRAAQAIQATALVWHERWDAVVCPGGEYATLSFADAIGQFDQLEVFGEAICHDISLAYPEEETVFLQSIFANALRRHRALYVESYQQNEREFNALADLVNDLLLDVGLGNTSKEEALRKVRALETMYLPKSS